MRNLVVSGIVAIFIMAAACNSERNEIPSSSSQSMDGVSSTSLASIEVDFAQSGCRQPDGQGSVDPAMSIFSMVFAVNGEEIEVVPGETLPVDPGDEVRLVEVSLCVGRYSNSPGEVCVDLAPVTVEDEELSSLHSCLHTSALAVLYHFY